MHLENIEARKSFGLCQGFKVCTSARDLGSFIGDDKSKRDWMKDHTHAWVQKIHTIIKTAGKYPQESYAAVVRVTELKWIFLHHAMKNIG